LADINTAISVVDSITFIYSIVFVPQAAP